MRNGSWTAAATVVTLLSTAWCLPVRGDDASDPSPAEKHSIQLRLVIRGLGSGGCDVQVKPGNLACKFRPQVKHAASDGDLKLDFDDVEIRGADRNCSFAITMSEPGQSPMTIYRAIRIPARNAAAKGAKTIPFTCFMNSPSKLANLGLDGKTRR